MGDFNLPKINWETLYCNTSDDDFHVKFVECVNDCYLFQHVCEPTRVRGADEPNVLDLVFSNEEGMIRNLVQEAPLGKSDHSVLRFTVKCTPEKPPPQIKSYYEKANYKKMIDMFNESNWEEKILDFDNFTISAMQPMPLILPIFHISTSALYQFSHFINSYISTNSTKQPILRCNQFSKCTIL